MLLLFLMYFVFFLFKPSNFPFDSFAVPLICAFYLLHNFLQLVRHRTESGKLTSSKYCANWIRWVDLNPLYAQTDRVPYANTSFQLVFLESCMSPHLPCSTTSTAIPMSLPTSPTFVAYLWRKFKRNYHSHSSVFAISWFIHSICQSIIDRPWEKIWNNWHLRANDI